MRGVMDVLESDVVVRALCRVIRIIAPGGFGVVLDIPCVLYVFARPDDCKFAQNLVRFLQWHPGVDLVFTNV